MDYQELEELRRRRWHQDGNAVRTLEAARGFMDEVGLCAMYPEPHQQAAPTFIGAWLGRGHSLPVARAAFAHPEAAEAEAMKMRLIRERAAYEWPLHDSVLLIATPVFPFFYALAADRGGRQQPTWAAGQKLSRLARDAWSEFERAKQPLSEEQLRRQLGKGVSEAALRRALHELWQRLRVTLVDRNEEGAIWDALARSSQQAVAQGEQLSVSAALSALVSQFLDAMIAAEPAHIESFFSPLVGRAKVRDAVSALLAARQVSAVQVGSQNMLQITPEKIPIVPRPPRERPAAGDPRRQPLRPRRMPGRKPA